ncbi:Isocitrate/isopropylmalate dehydrogenase [Natronobacterium texcoconense]|uniref:Isocitrate/isopropylmalate dehydrogenase n=1 Tax=Natronobacterium texcoconense TaxID=1095778 RepID=A0A1H1IGI9_NATTX|nr:Isocitrate/isopropylmalate dehydrogenase [Natronobacterium texcoconense]
MGGYDSEIAVIPGDGIGQEITPAAVEVLEGLDDAQRKALVEGVWDTSALMKSNVGEVRKKAEELLYVEDERV